MLAACSGPALVPTVGLSGSVLGHGVGVGLSCAQGGVGLSCVLQQCYLNIALALEASCFRLWPQPDSAVLLPGALNML